MTIQQFQPLNELDKVAAIMQHGRLLAQSIEDDCRIFIYKFDNFYVSTKYHAADDQLKEIKSFLQVREAMPHSRKTLISIHPAGRVHDLSDREQIKN